MSLPSSVTDYQTPQPGENESLDILFSLLARTTKALGEETTLHLDMFTDPEAAVILLLRLREARKELQTLEAAVEATSAERMTGKELRFPGYVAERRGGWRRVSWQHDALAWRLIEDIAVDQRTGEVSEDIAAAVAVCRDRILNAASIGSWRTTQLKPLGIDPDDFSESIQSRRTVEVRRAEADQ